MVLLHKNGRPCGGLFTAVFLSIISAMMAQEDDHHHQIHVALGTQPSEIRISWASTTAATAGSSTAFVRKQNTTEPYTRYPSEIVATYAKSHTEYPYVPDYASPFLHSVVVDGLDADGAIYEYYVQDDDEEEVILHAFKTLPSKPTYPTRLILLGDHGQTEFSATTVDEMLRWDVSNASTRAAACLLVGDLSYADGENPRWDRWEKMVEPIFAEMPLITLPGNHETEATSDGDAFLAYRLRYLQPGLPEIVKPGSVLDYSSYTYNLTYEFGASYFGVDVGPARVLALNTYVDASEGSLQRAWVEREVFCLDRVRTPWLIVSMHGPWYSTNAKHRIDDETATKQHRDGLEKIVAGARAAVVYAGHVHAYERSHPVCESEVRNSGEAPVFVTIGDGGNREELYDVWPFAGDEPWSAFRNGTRYGFGDLTFVDDEHAVWRWLPNQLGGPADEITIVNPYFLSGSEPACVAPDANDFDWDCDDPDVVAEVQRRVASYDDTEAPKSKKSSDSAASEGTVRVFTIVVVIFVATFIALAALYSLRSAKHGAGPVVEDATRGDFAPVGGLELPDNDVLGSDDLEGDSHGGTKTTFKSAVV